MMPKLPRLWYEITHRVNIWLNGCKMFAWVKLYVLFFYLMESLSKKIDLK